MEATSRERRDPLPVVGATKWHVEQANRIRSRKFRPPQRHGVAQTSRVLCHRSELGLPVQSEKGPGVESAEHSQGRSGFQLLIPFRREFPNSGVMEHKVSNTD